MDSNSNSDDYLRAKLNSLKDPTGSIPTDEELYDRLKKLRGTPVNSVVDNRDVLFSKPKTEIEQVDDLLTACACEINLEKGFSSTSVDDLEKRLHSLKSVDNAPFSNIPNKQAAVSTSESDTKHLLRKILAEAEMERRMEMEYHESQSYSKNVSYSDEEEFCTICVRSSNWMCLDCDKHFCARCYQEFHDEIVERHNRKPVLRRKPTISDSD